MGFLKRIINRKEEPVRTYDDFWNWFQANEKDFFYVLKGQDNIERKFFHKLSSRLNQLREGYWFLAGMYDNDTAELVLTADGVLKNIVFVEELVNAAPNINRWKFTALKPELDIDDVSINMDDLRFDKRNLFFYSNDDPGYPDEIDITVVHSDYREELKDPVTNGVYIFIDNYLGELNSVTTIDNMQVMGKDQAKKELIPIEKLKDFLTWRQKEFIEKYEGTRYNTENDNYHSLEATLTNGNPLIAIVNSTLLDWDSKVSHPWILSVEIKYKGNENGMPDKEAFDLMNKFEDKLMLELKDSDGYLNIGRQTGEGVREIYFACKDFRLPSTILANHQSDYKSIITIEYDIYKDKYWRSFERLKPGID